MPSSPRAGPTRPGAFPGLAALLWTTRESLADVLYHLALVRLVVTDGSVRWLPRADADLQRALADLHSAEVLRAAEVEGITGAVRRKPRHSLAALTTAAPDPWPDVFAAHRTALLHLVGEIEAGAAENRRVLQAALRRNRMPVACASRPTRDEASVTASAAYHSALATLDALPQLSLADFLA